MKIIDEKGRLFGKLNIIDLTVIIMVLALVAGVFYKAVLPRLSIFESKTTLEDVYITVLCRNQPSSIEDYLKVGDSLIAKNDYVDGEIFAFYTRPSEHVGSDANGKPVMSESPYGWLDVYVVIKGQADPNSAVFQVGTQEMRVGYRIYVKTKSTEMNGQIEQINFGEFKEPAFD